MIPQTVCPVVVEAVVDAARTSAVQAVAARNKLPVLAVRNEFGGVVVIEIVLPADVDRSSALGWPRYVPLLDALRAAGGSFEGEPKPVAGPDCQPERSVQLPIRASGYAFIFDAEGGRRFADAAKQLNVPIATYKGDTTTAVTLRAEQPTGSLMFRLKRGDFGAMKEGGALLPGTTILNPAAALARSGK